MKFLWSCPPTSLGYSTLTISCFFLKHTYLFILLLHFSSSSFSSSSFFFSSSFSPLPLSPPPPSLPPPSPPFLPPLSFFFFCLLLLLPRIGLLFAAYCFSPFSLDLALKPWHSSMPSPMDDSLKNVQHSFKNYLLCFDFSLHV